MADEPYRQIPYQHVGLTSDEMVARSKALLAEMWRRRSVRHFSDESVPRSVIENILSIASSAPSGANKQPWTFCAVSDPELKKRIREAAEAEERESYAHRMNAEWLADLAPIGTDWRKPFIETAPWILVVFRRAWLEKPGGRGQTYYSQESVGIATGFLLAAVHQCGLVALTHTPSPMNFLQDLLKRPPNERAYMLIPVGLPASDAMVPDIGRHGLDEVTAFYEGTQ
jgi:iodotyrosine deiodinase